MQINLETGDDLTIKLGDRGYVDIEWLSVSGDPFISIFYEENTKAKVETKKLPKDQFYSTTVRLKKTQIPE